jgi:hypothetical protein
MLCVAPTETLENEALTKCLLSWSAMIFSNILGLLVEQRKAFGFFFAPVSFFFGEKRKEKRDEKKAKTKKNYLFSYNGTREERGGR